MAHQLFKEEKLKSIIDEMENELNWRGKEFRIIKIHMHELDRADNKTKVNIFKKMAIPTIYAQWEGFCVSIFKIILRYLDGLRLSYDIITTRLFTYSHSKTYNYLKGKQSFEQRCKFTEEFLSTLDSKYTRFDVNISTKSNLNYSVLEELCDQIGLCTENLSQYESKLNEFVRIRNAICHGENSFIFTNNQVIDYMKLITKLMDTLFLESVDFLTKKRYLKQNDS